jgi:hypothetical protein
MAKALNVFGIVWARDSEAGFIATLLGSFFLLPIF